MAYLPMGCGSETLIQFLMVCPRWGCETEMRFRYDSECPQMGCDSVMLILICSVSLRWGCETVKPTRFGSASLPRGYGMGWRSWFVMVFLRLGYDSVKRIQCEKASLRWGCETVRQTLSLTECPLMAKRFLTLMAIPKGWPTRWLKDSQKKNQTLSRPSHWQNRSLLYKPGCRLLPSI